MNFSKCEGKGKQAVFLELGIMPMMKAKYDESEDVVSLIFGETVGGSFGKSTTYVIAIMFPSMLSFLKT